MFLHSLRMREKAYFHIRCWPSQPTYHLSVFTLYAIISAYLSLSSPASIPYIAKMSPTVMKLITPLITYSNSLAFPRIALVNNNTFKLNYLL